MGDQDEELRVIVTEENLSGKPDGFNFSGGERPGFNDKGMIDRLEEAFATGLSGLKLDKEDADKFEKLAFTVGRLAVPVGTLAVGIGSLELALSKTNSLIAKIEGNSPQVQIAQIEANLIKMRSDRQVDREFGKDLREIIKLQARQDAAYTRLEAQVFKLFNPIVQGWQSFKTGLFETLATGSENLGKVIKGEGEQQLRNQTYVAALEAGRSYEEARQISIQEGMKRVEAAAEGFAKINIFDHIANASDANRVLPPVSKPINVGAF